MMVRTCTRFVVLFALSLVLIASCFQAKAPFGKSNILVVVSDENDQENYTKLISFLEGHDFTVDVRLVYDEELVLFGDDGYHKYDGVLYLAPEAEEFGAGITATGLIEYVDSGRSLFLAADQDYSDFFNNIVEAMGIDMDESDTLVIDHGSYAPELDAEFDGLHTVVHPGSISPVSAIIPEELDPSQILFHGIAASCFEDNELIDPILFGSKTAYTATPKTQLNEAPMVSSNDVVLAAALQTRNSARIIYVGSKAMLTDKFIESGGDVQAKFVEYIVTWCYGVRGVLRVSNPKHHRVGEEQQHGMYRVMDKLHFSIDIEEWDGVKDEWVSFKGKDVQLEFTMLNPYERRRLDSAEGSKRFESFVQVPDVIGIYKFVIQYFRPGYSVIDFLENVSIRPFDHNEYPRFITQAFPYYTGAFSMLFGVVIFGVVLLFGQPTIDAAKSQ